MDSVPSSTSATSGSERRPADEEPTADAWDDMVLVGRIVRTHGLRGDVVILPETDFAEERFATGCTVWRLHEGRPSPLRIGSARIQGGRPVVRFEGLDALAAVEPFVGLELRVPPSALRRLPTGMVYHHQLVGCRVETSDGRVIGHVERVDGGSGASVLAVAASDGEVLIPFATSICVSVDVTERLIRVDPPDGLLELNVRVGRVRRGDDVTGGQGRAARTTARRG